MVPANVEEKIRYLLRKFPSTEWSGVLFFSHEGTFEDDNLIITCQDIYPMDLGNATFTEFQMSSDVASYIAQNIDLFDCEMGLVHSHHNMAAFFSGTDLSTLQEEGNERNCFVSLIVNNAGEYCAAITRKMQTKSEVTVKNLGQSYEFFGDGEVQLSESEEETKEINSEVIEYFTLDVERHAVENPLEYLDQRFDEIKKKKTTSKNPTIIQTSFWGNDYDRDKEFYQWLHKEGKKPEQAPEKDDKPESEADDSLWVPDDALVDKVLTKMITCSLIINPINFNLDSWIEKHMKRLYQEMFGICTDGSPTAEFDNWKGYIVEFAISYLCDNSTIPDWVDPDYVQNTIAETLSYKLQKYLDSNVYIKEYIAEIENYML